jgi:membrane protease YdiL (CAAX protease family)
MNWMPGPFRKFALTLTTVWLVLAAGGAAYAGILGLPARLAAPIIAAFLWEASFYLVPGFPGIREAAEKRWRPPILASGLVASAVAPYLVCTLPTGTFHWGALILLASVAAAACFWFLLLPRNGFSDVGFILLMAAVKLFGVFAFIYPTVAPKVPLEILGFLMWIRLGVMAVLSFRGAEGIGFGFIPTKSDWLIGIREFCLFLPIGLPLALAIGFVRYRPMPLEWWQWPGAALGTFLGMLWVVALAEEFLFRGLLQQRLSLWLGSSPAGCVLASIAFGLAHLPFGRFPNWRFALVAGVAGLFYGRAYAKSGGIRAAMVAHALMNTCTQMLFTRL